MMEQEVEKHRHQLQDKDVAYNAEKGKLLQENQTLTRTLEQVCFLSLCLF